MTSLVSSIRQSQRIALVSHVHPDGDAIGSLLGLTLGLLQLGKTATPYLRDGVPELFRFMEGWESILTDPLASDADLCIVLDLPDATRTGYSDVIKGYAKRKSLGQIDHHPAGDIEHFATTRLVSEETSSTCELVYNLLKELGVRITPSIATALLTGMYTDTGGFQYANTREQTMQDAAELMRRGGALQKVVQHITHQKSVAHLKLVGLALERLTLSWQGRCAVSVVTHEDIKSCGATDEDITGVVNELNTLTGVEFVLLLTELKPGEIRGSFRTTDGSYFNVAALARTLGGGGHPRAAGFTLESTLQQTPTGWRVAPFLLS